MSTIPEIQSRDDLLLKSLLNFFGKDPQHLKDVYAISSQKTSISLREMDFTVTNYSKKNKKLDGGKLFQLHLDYKAQLRGHSKKQFDPFCRVDKKETTRLGRFFIDFETMTPIHLNYDDKELIEKYKLREDGVVTTVGQLNFFRWAIKNKVIEYCFNNKGAIVEAMNAEAAKKKAAKAEAKKQKEQDQQRVIVHFP